MKKKPDLRYSIFLLLALLLAGCGSSFELNGSVYQSAEPAPDIPLDDTSGEPFSLGDYSDQVVLIYFGYTHCPDICPATLADLKWVDEQVQGSAEKLQVVFVSIDPERDDPDAIRGYLDQFNADFIGLSGTQQELEPILAAFGVLAQRDPGQTENYTMTHTSRVFLIDPEGRLRTNYTFDESREVILADVKKLTGQ